MEEFTSFSAKERNRSSYKLLVEESHSRCFSAMYASCLRTGDQESLNGLYLTSGKKGGIVGARGLRNGGALTG